MEKNIKKIMLAIFSLLTACLTNAQSSISTNGGYVGTTAPPNALNITIEANEFGGLSGVMPFELPEGFGGLTPQLSLVYNSATEISDFGRGFSLGGVPTITRGGKDSYHDKDVAGVTFTNDDRFYLDGQRLLLYQGKNGEKDAVYYGEYDPYTSIVITGGMTSKVPYSRVDESNSTNSTDPIITFPPSTFEATTQDGTNMVFGSGNAIVKKGAKEYLSWAINKITDIKGNSIEYNYDNSNGQKKLISILYTQNKSGGIDTQYKVNITYENYSGDYVNIGGVKIKYESRIKSISVSDYKMNVELIKYEFTYNADNLLLEIIKKYRGLNACNPIEIKWLNPESSNTTDVKNSNDAKYPPSITCQLYEIKPHISISSITNGLGVKTEINYKNLGNSSNCTKLTTSNLPSGVNEYSMPIWVVNGIKVSNGTNIYSNCSYTYGNCRVDNTFGFLGFNTITQNNLISPNKKNVLTYDCQFVKYGKRNPFLSKKESYCDGVITSQEEYVWDFLRKHENLLDFYYQYQKSCKISGCKVLPKTITQELDLSVGKVNKVTTSYGGVITEVNEVSYNSMGLPTTTKTTRTQNGGSVASTIEMVYDNYGNLIKQYDKERNCSTTYIYNSSNHTNLLSAYNSATKIKTTYSYDSGNKFVTKETTTYNNGKSLSTEYTYDSYGFKISETSASGLVTKYAYDKFGQLVYVTYPNGDYKKTSYGWSSSYNSKLYVTISDGMGNSSTTYYDAIGRVTCVSTSPKGGTTSTTTTTYNSNGTVAKVESSVDGTTSYAYNSAGEVTSISSKGRTVYYSNTPTSSTETVNGVTKTSKYDNAGQLISVTDITGTITYKYHKTGQVNEINVGGITTKMEYDDFGRQTKLVDADAGTTTYTYDALDRIVMQKNAKGITTTITYDANYGWETLRTETLGTTTRKVNTFYYDDVEKFGLVKSQTDNESGTMTSYKYDDYGRITEKIDEIHGVNYLFSYSYNMFGQVTEKTFPDNVAIQYSYNGNYLSSITEKSSKIKLQSNITYNSRGQVTGYTQGNGNKVAFTYDSYGFIKSESFGSSSQKVTNNYTFDPITQNLTRRSTSFNWMYTNLSEEFTYDQADRLVDWQIAAPGGTSNKNVVSYQANGNILQKSGVGYYMYNKTHPHAMSTVKELGGESSMTRKTTEEYNTFNKVSSITCSNTGVKSTFSYGPDNQRRTMTKNGNKTVYVGSSYQVNNNGKQNLHYIKGAYGLGALIVRENNKNTIYYLQADYQGSVVASFKDNGKVWSVYSYDPWGRRRVCPNWLLYKVDNSSIANINTNNYAVSSDASLSLITRGYTGHEHLDEYGLINMNGRLYDYTTARFLSPDPYVQSPTNSQNYNRYSYCLNNPLKYTDPSGCITQLQMQISATISGSKYDEYNGGGGYGGGGGGRAGYSYNYTNGCYYDNYTGRRVDYSEVHNNYIKPNSTRVNVDYYQSYSVKESNGGYAYGDGKYVGCTYGGTNNTMLTVVYNNNGNVVASCIYEGGTSVVAKRSNSLSSLASVGMVNNMTNSAANSINRNAPNARYGSNGKVYWNGKFYGNQYVATKAISTISRPVANGTFGLGLLISGAQVGASFSNEGYWGPQTQATAASAVGGMAGSSLGAWGGAAAGLAIGGPVGAVIGGFIGGVCGSIGGSLVTEKAYEYYYGY